MDAKTPEVLYVTAVFTNATGVKFILPLAENLKIVEFGAYNGPGADNVAAAVLKLQGIDTTAGGATYTDLATLTHTSALVQGSFQGKRTDVLIEKEPTVLNSTARTNRAVTPVTDVTGPDYAGPVIVLPSVEKQFIAVQLNVTTAYTASVAPYFYIKVQKCGSGSTAISGESQV